MPKESGSSEHIASRRPGDGRTAPERAFFGRRKGHALKPRQLALFETLLPKVTIDLGTPAPADLRALFPTSINDVRLEIGFGGAEHLISEATAHPQTGFIGTDAFVNAIGKALAAIDAAALTNIRLYFGDAIKLIDWLPDGGLTRIDLLYPDPWPKRRHWKRRFIQDENLVRLARILKRNGELRFATDIGDYAAHTLARILRSTDFTWTAEHADDWRRPWKGFCGTRYEAKARHEGRTPAYFIFRRL
ncbi:MAG TPA: tRNA (guanine(46)-N(7))-methyltransferase TrmB [Pseudolabrys sp.]